MKYLIFTFAILCVSLSFSQKNKKFIPEKDMVKISLLPGEHTMKVGQKFYYSGHTHGSVGEQYSISCQSSAFEQVDKHFVYDDIKKSEMSGGDGGTMTMVYQALKPGVYTVIIKDLFRGEVKYTYELKITVKEK